MGDGDLEVLKLCKIVNLGWRVAMIREPFWYLDRVSSSEKTRG